VDAHRNPAAERWLAVGQSAEADARAAGRQAAAAALAGEEPKLMVVFSGFAGGAPVAGFYTYGEIARTHGISGFHNQTLVVLAVG